LDQNRIKEALVRKKEDETRWTELKEKKIARKTLLQERKENLRERNSNET
jgi:hypothetical protein